MNYTQVSLRSAIDVILPIPENFPTRSENLPATITACAEEYMCASFNNSITQEQMDAYIVIHAALKDLYQLGRLNYVQE